MAGGIGVEEAGSRLLNWGNSPHGICDGLLITALKKEWMRDGLTDG